MSREAVLENVRRFRTIASLYRQTAAFRPGQSWSLLGQAKDWEYRALAELESTFKGSAQPTSASWRSLSPPKYLLGGNRVCHSPRPGTLNERSLVRPRRDLIG